MTHYVEVSLHFPHFQNTTANGITTTLRTLKNKIHIHVINSSFFFPADESKLLRIYDIKTRNTPANSVNSKLNQPGWSSPVAVLQNFPEEEILCQVKSIYMVLQNIQK